MTDREKIIQTAKSFIGAKNGNPMHLNILKIYNTQKNLPEGYKVKTHDSWCATYVSAVFLKAGLGNLIATECSCPRMIEKNKAKGIWIENDAYKPSPGDIIMYDWNDDGVGDNTGNPDHVGIVVSVDNDRISIIEGNKSYAVGYRNIYVNGRYIRGFIVPRFEEKEIVKMPTNNNVPSDWAKPAWEKATQLKFIDGTRPKDPVTRQELAAVICRLLKEM